MELKTENSTPIATIDAEAQRMAQHAQRYVIEADNYVCEDRAQFLTGADQLRTIKGVSKQLEDKRLSVTKPLNDVIKTINDWFRGPKAALDQAERRYKDRMGAFEQIERRKLAEQQAEADRKARLEQEELERRAQKAIDRGNTEKAAQLMIAAAEVQPAKAELAPVKAAGMSFGEIFDFEVIDAELIPREYLMVDLSKIRQQVKLDKSVKVSEQRIPGIRVFSRPQVGARAVR